MQNESVVVEIGHVGHPDAETVAALAGGRSHIDDIADDRETPATAVIRKLRRLGADVTAHDPYLDSLSVDGEPVAPDRGHQVRVRSLQAS